MDLVYLSFIFQLYYCDFNFCNNKLYCCSLVDCWQFNCTSGLALGRKVSAWDGLGTIFAVVDWIVKLNHNKPLFLVLALRIGLKMEFSSKLEGIHLQFMHIYLCSLNSTSFFFMNQCCSQDQNFVRSDFLNIPTFIFRQCQEKTQILQFRPFFVTVIFRFVFSWFNTRFNQFNQYVLHFCPSPQKVTKTKKKKNWNYVGI